MERIGTASQAEKISQLLDQLGEELAFTIAGEDTGLLAINRCVMDMEDASLPDDPPQLTAGLGVARQWIDLTLDGSAKFSDETIASINSWHPWMMQVIDAWQHGDAMPAVPSEWGDAVTTSQAAATPPAEAKTGPEAPSGEEKSITLNLQGDGELLREFHGESVELLQSIEEGLIVLEGNPRDADTINSIFRAFHTFKGGAGFLHLAAMQDLAHDLESLLAAARREELSITSGIVDLILSGADALKQFTNEIGAQLNGTGVGSPIVVPTSALMLRLQAALRGELPPAASAPSAAPEPPPANEPAKDDPPSEENKPSSTLASRPAQSPAKKKRRCPSRPKRSCRRVLHGLCQIGHPQARPPRGLGRRVGHRPIDGGAKSRSSKADQPNPRSLSPPIEPDHRGTPAQRHVPAHGSGALVIHMVRPSPCDQHIDIQQVTHGKSTSVPRVAPTVSGGIESPRPSMKKVRKIRATKCS